MSFELIVVAMPMSTLLLGMGMMVGLPFLEKAYLLCKYTEVMRGFKLYTLHHVLFS